MKHRDFAAEMRAQLKRELLALQAQKDTMDPAEYERRGQALLAQVRVVVRD